MRTNKLLNVKQILICILFITSCDNDDEKIISLVGTWNFVTGQIVEFENGVQTNTVTENNLDLVLTINADNTYTAISSIENETGTWSQPSQDQLRIVTSDGFVSIFIIITLNEITLIVERTEEDIISGITFKTVETFTYSRA